MPTVSLQEMVMTMHAYFILSWLLHLPFELLYDKISLDCWQVAQNATANLLTKSSRRLNECQFFHWLSIQFLNPSQVSSAELVSQTTQR